MLYEIRYACNGRTGSVRLRGPEGADWQSVFRRWWAEIYCPWWGETPAPEPCLLKIRAE